MGVTPGPPDAMPGAPPPPPRRPVAGRLGILGGTFDPIHLGHLVIAEEAREALGLERVLFVPAGDPWQKADEPVSPIEDRVAMVALAIADARGFELSRLEVDRPGPSYTADTLESLAAEALAAGREPDLWLIVSVETLGGLTTWHQPERVLRACRLAVVPRVGWSAPEAGWLEARFPGLGDRASFLDGPRIDLSSSEIRARVAAGRSVRYLVPDAVAVYIGDHGLYTDSSRREDAP